MEEDKLPKENSTSSIPHPNSNLTTVIPRTAPNVPTNIKSGLDALSGTDLSDVKVHYNSAKPIQLNTLAYAQGDYIHLGSSHEIHLPHEGWHVVQQ